MSVEMTLSIIKPDAVGRGLIGEILKRFESAGLKIVAGQTSAFDAGTGPDLLRGPQRAAIFCESLRLHVFWAYFCFRCWKVRERLPKPRNHGGHRPGQSGAGNDSQGLGQRC